MPREFNSFVRPVAFESAQKFYVLGYEGTVTEKKYFKALRESDLFNDSGEIEIVPVLRRSKDGSSSPKKVKELLKEAKDDYNFRPTDEFWLIIDRDDWETIHHINLQQLCDECKAEHNFFVALSNPCFEFWLILHFCGIENFDSEERKKIYLNTKVSKTHNYVNTVITRLSKRGYKKVPPMDILLPHVKDAIARAKALHIEGEDYPHYFGSDVYKLVERLV